MGVAIGVKIPHGTDIVGFARLAEDLGYDYVASGEHVVFHGATDNAFVSLALAAGATERIRLVSTVTLLPLYPAALAAKMAATLDVGSHGRLEIGIGVGGENATEFLACGVPPAERGPRTDEGMEILDRLLRGESVTYEGRWAQLADVRLDPPVVQRPRPPFWFGGRKPPAIRRAGRYADVWMPIFQTPAMLAESLAAVRSHAVAAGRAAADVTGGIFVWTDVDQDSARSRERAGSTLSHIYHQDFTRLVDRYAAAGDPKEVAARLLEFAEAGAERVIISPACPDEDVEAVVTLLAREVLPLVRRSAG